MDPDIRQALAHAERYQPTDVESRWQARWEADGLYRRPPASDKPRHFALSMYPYPSGNLHIGHWYAFAPSDTHARFMRMKGYDVFFPMGFDAFGLPAENAAIKRGVDPKIWTLSNVDYMRTQFRSMGAMFDWSAEVVTCLPEYYRWNQWFFLKFYEAGLAYRKRAAVDFCPNCNTTLAREQVVGDQRVCERCSTPVVKRELEQWFLAITRYADRLLEGLDDIDWPERVKTMQRNWIGRSVGAEIDFPTTRPIDFPTTRPIDPPVPRPTDVAATNPPADAATDAPVRAFTTRPDTLFGATAVMLAPEHPAVERFTTAERRAAVADYQAQAARQSEVDRLSTERDKTGVWTGGWVFHPLTAERLPVWVADFVLPTYGTGALMSVPAHDERDFAFATKYGLEIREVIRPASSPEGERRVDAGGRLAAPYTGPGFMVNSGALHGTPSTAKHAAAAWTPELAAAYGLPAAGEMGVEAKAAVIAALEAVGRGRAAVSTRLRDWLISRQRYWGTPIPIVYCPRCGAVPVPEGDLPVLLPEGVSFLPTGESPLKLAAEWKNVPCPRCGAPAERDTDTMDTFVDSSWYQYRYLSPHDDTRPFDPDAAREWLPIHQYTGGIEHATMHLLYTRFWTKVMHDLGLVDFEEPMRRLFNQGIILGEDSEKMSKSRGNVVDPDELVTRYGADTVRAFLMFIGPWDQGGPWDSRSIQGVVRLMFDVWDVARLGLDGSPSTGAIASAYDSDGVRVGGAEGDTEDGRNIAATDGVGADRRSDETSNAVAARALRRATHQTLAKVGADLEAFAFNTAIAALMDFRNTLKSSRSLVGTPEWEEAVDTLLLMLAPIAPHVAEELWAQRGRSYSIHQQPWPAYDPVAAAADTFELVIQVLGKTRGKVEAPVGLDEAGARAAALAHPAVTEALGGREPRRVIYVPGRLVNVVV